MTEQHEPSPRPRCHAADLAGGPGGGAGGDSGGSGGNGKAGGHSRRNFLKGVGLVGAGAALLPGGARADSNTGIDGGPAIEGLKVYGRDARAVGLKINGAAKNVTVEPRTTLLEALRHHAGYTGPKEVCDRGSCGACTVLVDGESVCSCMMLADDAEGREVTTIEGIAADPEAAALIDSFCEYDGAQCGFCIPGFVTRAREITAASSGAMSFDEVREQLAGNVCRCGTYTKIFDAVMAATGASIARHGHNDVALENDGLRTDIREKVTGAAKYTADMMPDGMLWAAYVRMPYGAGRIRSVAVDAARRVPGIVEVEVEQGAEARYVGGRMGHVVGDSRNAVEDAIDAMNLAFRIGDVKTDPNEFYSGPPQPDAETAQQLAQIYASGTAVVEATYATQIQTHSCLEPHGMVVDHKGDSATVWASTQGTYSVRDGMPGPTGLKAEDIVVLCNYVGGGFGSKFGPGAEGDLAARMSRKHGRPCRVMLNRREEHVDGGNRPGSIQYMKVAADAEGKLIGGRIHTVGVVGHSPGGGRVNNPFTYDFGMVESSHQDITLTAEPPRAFRAPGHPQGVFAVEMMIDELADQLGIDPLEMRAKNETNQRRVAQAQRGAEMIGWNRRRPFGAASGRYRRGLGMGAAHWHFWPTECLADCTIHRDGRVVIESGVQDIGTGTKTVAIDVAADQLGVDRSRIAGRVGDSRYPEGPGSGGSVTARSLAPAVRDACQQAKEELLGLVAEAMNVNAGELVVEGDRVVHADGRSMAWERACNLIAGGGTIAKRGSLKREYLGEGDTSATQFVDVTVDTHTGIMRVNKVVAVQACGQIVNRKMTENQVCGGVIQGLSYAMFEERRLDPTTGGMVNPNLEWYKISGSFDIPEIVPVLDVVPGDTGVRALGEPTTIPTAGATANAVANAIGARVRSLPITPQKVLAALEAAAGNAPQGGRA